MPEITSLQNPHVKDAVRLRDRRQREKQGRTLIDGARELHRAIEAGVKLIEAFVCESLCTGVETQRLLAALPQSGGAVIRVSAAVFEKLAFGQRAEGVLGVVETPRPTLDTVATAIIRGGLTANSRGLTAPGKSAQASLAAIRGALAPDYRAGEKAAQVTRIIVPLVAVLEGVEKPGNLGAVLRSADAAGVAAVIVADARTDLYNPNAIRASMGTIFTLPVCEATGSDVLDWLQRNGFQILAARVDGAVPYTEIDYRGPTVIVLGSEAAGLSSIWTGPNIRAVRLPMLGVSDSLNVSVTAAVLFYEALRQRLGG